MGMEHFPREKQWTQTFLFLKWNIPSRPVAPQREILTSILRHRPGMRLEIAGRWCCSPVHPGQYLLSDEGETVMWTLSTRQCEKNVDDICFPVPTSGASASETQVYQLFITATALEGGSENVARAFLKWLDFLKPPTAVNCCLKPLGSLDAWPDRYFVLGALLLLRMMPYWLI